MFSGSKMPGDRGASRGLPYRPLLLAALLWISQPSRIGADDRLDIRHERYLEEDNRITVHTSALQFSVSPLPSTVLQGDMVYDSISGATPTGAPPLPGSTRTPLVVIDDTRWAGTFGVRQQFGRHAFNPQIAYSTENDYESYGYSLGYSVDLNDRNTTLTLAASHAKDRLLPGTSNLTTIEHKRTTDVLVGITQLLGPRTVLSANLTLGRDSGYLSDPYKLIAFPDWDPSLTFPEQRPDSRDRQVGPIISRKPERAPKSPTEFTTIHLVFLLTGSRSPGIRNGVRRF